MPYLDPTASALSHWETGYITAYVGPHPWGAEYQAAVREVLPTLKRYHTLAELVATYYGLELYRAVEQACMLTDGRMLNFETVRDAAYWVRWRAIQGSASA
jgi:hypothetical protein